MSKPILSPLQRFRRKHCDGCSYHDACLSDKSIELRCLLAALLDATSRRIEEMPEKDPPKKVQPPKTHT